MKTSTLLVLCLSYFLGACVCSAPATRDTPEEEVLSREYACQADDALVFVCGRSSCGFYRCRDLAYRNPVLTRGVGGVAPQPAGAAMRWWGSVQELPDAQPVFVIPWREPPKALTLYEEIAAKAKRPVEKHHIFPQEFKKWFTRPGRLDSIHEYTLLLDAEEHQRIHRGMNGGPWNEAWREWIKGHDDALKADIWRHACELCFEFRLLGVVVPYYGLRKGK
jgi:uncharacterized lipoprotein (TIGR02269 family)